jgi:hypothetical protein
LRLGATSMKIIAFSALALGFGLLSVELSACSNSSDDCNATATCGNAAGTHAGTAGKSGGGGSDAEGGSGGTPSTGGSSSGTSGTSGTMGTAGDGGGGPGACTGDVSDDAACWTTNALGVFVSSESGDDATGDGTKELPFATITKGIASAGGKNVYVCLGATKDTYAEQVSLNATTDGIRIYGGFDCATWDYSTKRSVLVSPDSNIALRIAGLKTGAYIENVRFVAADATGTGFDASSYGAFVTDSKGVMFKRVDLTAGKGAKGKDQPQAEKGDDGPAVPSEADSPQNGKPAICSAPPATQPGGTWGEQSTCGSLGGDGGKGRSDANATGGAGDLGAPSTDVVVPGKDNSGPGASVLGVKGTGGGDGEDGLAGKVGTKSPDAGSFTGAGFILADGSVGKVGHTGQGGGGGGASKGNGTCVGASGGAGGMGGCGGMPGLGGIGGGASVALFSWASAVGLSEVTLTAGDGGVGGAGGAGGLRGQGADGAPGGVGSGQVNNGGRGGAGGDGGDGGSGSGGTGGPSYALAYSGTIPTYAADSTLQKGAGGVAGKGGSVSDVAAPDGSPGDSADVFEVK